MAAEAHLRDIPQDYAPVVAQALLNMFITCSPREIVQARNNSLTLRVQINRDFDAWLLEDLT